MENSIYCSPTHMKVIIGQYGKGRIHVEDFKEIPLPEGGMINGIITNVGVMTDFFDTVVKEHGIANEDILHNSILKNDTLLVVHTSNIQTKILEVPPVAETQVREFIQREFEHYDSSPMADEEVYDFTVLNPKGPGGGVEVLAASAPRALLESYRTAMVSANYRLKGINIGINCIIKLISQVPRLQGNTFMLADVERSSMTITLFLDGTYRLFNRYRLLNVPGSPEWLGEVGTNLSAMLQFNRSQRDQTDIKTTYVSGLPPQLLASLAQYGPQLNIGIENLDLSETVTVSEKVAQSGLFDPGRFLFTLGNLVKR